MATALGRKYRIDPFFRTEANIVSLHLLFSLAIMTLMGAALALLYQNNLDTIIERVQSNILSSSTTGGQSHVITLPSLASVQAWPLIAIIAAGVFITLVFGYFIVRAALLPAKNALVSQKQFIGNIAHELRTPLAIIKTNTEVRLFDGDVPKAAQELHQSTLEELDRISEIINNLLSLDTLVRPGALEFTDVDLGAVVEHAIRDLAELAKRRGVAVSVRLSDFRTVFGNHTALMQIAINILKNALSYTGTGGYVTVVVSPDYHGAVTLTVEDTGAGIAEKDLFRIFEPFYRGSASRTRGSGGSGLGLTIVSELVNLHHGKITVRSAPNRGTTVVISFPAGTDPKKITPAQVAGSEPDDTNNKSEIAVDFSATVAGNM